ncbi:fumarate hydratase C-terminal domain-containing protein [Escherichia coli]
MSQYPVSTRLSLNGTIIVGRDIAHAKLKERMDNGEGLPQTHQRSSDLLRGSGQNAGRLCLRFSGRTTAGRMDLMSIKLQAQGGSMIMLAKGNRSQQVTDAW